MQRYVPPRLPVTPTCLHADLMTRGQFSADRVGKWDMSDNASPKKCIHPMPSAIKKLIRYHKIQRLVLFLQRSDRRHGHDSANAQLLEAVDIGAEIQFAWEMRCPRP